MRATDFPARFVAGASVPRCRLSDRVGPARGGAGYLADRFARASGKSAAVFVAGPGATNVISAVANASVNQVPMLILTGEVAVGEFGLHSQQDTSDDGLGLGATFRRFCRCSVSIESIANARSKIDSAFRALASILADRCTLLCRAI